jgi:hypothetical protein
LIIILSAPSPAGGGSGSLRFVEKTHDFGIVNRLSKQSHDFEFENVSGKPVLITDVITSCGCMAAVVGKKRVAPGGSGKIEVTFDPTGRSGKFLNVVKVLTDASGIPYPLYIKGDVQIAGKSEAGSPVIEVSPKSLDLGRVRLGQTTQYKIVVTNIGEGTLNITNFHAKNRSSGVPLNSKPIGKGKRVELTAYYICDRKGPFEDFLVLRSNDPVNPTVGIRLTGIAE